MQAVLIIIRINALNRRPADENSAIIGHWTLYHAHLLILSLTLLRVQLQLSVTHYLLLLALLIAFLV